jgi:ribosomal-protein-serine acetyltransferase
MAGVKTPLLLDIPNDLSGERVILRTPRAGDGALVSPGVCESLAELKLWMPWATDAYSEQSGEEWCRKAAGDFLSRHQLQYLIFLREENRPVGAIGAFKFNWDIPSCEIGYWLRTSHTHCGYTTEALGVLLAMLRVCIQVRRVEIRVDAKNLKSRRVAELAGFQLEGILRSDSFTVGGGLRDTCVFSWISSG